MREFKDRFELRSDRTSSNSKFDNTWMSSSFGSSSNGLLVASETGTGSLCFLFAPRSASRGTFIHGRLELRRSLVMVAVVDVAMLYSRGGCRYQAFWQSFVTECSPDPRLAAVDEKSPGMWRSGTDHSECILARCARTGKWIEAGVLQNCEEAQGIHELYFIKKCTRSLTWGGVAARMVHFAERS